MLRGARCAGRRTSLGNSTSPRTSRAPNSVQLVRRHCGRRGLHPRTMRTRRYPSKMGVAGPLKPPPFGLAAGSGVLESPASTPTPTPREIPMGKDPPPPSPALCADSATSAKIVGPANSTRAPGQRPMRGDLSRGGGACHFHGWRSKSCGAPMRQGPGSPQSLRTNHFQMAPQGGPACYNLPRGLARQAKAIVTGQGPTQTRGGCLPATGTPPDLRGLSGHADARRQVRRTCNRQ